MMKKYLIILFCLMAVAGTQEVSAQKWLKKLGKVAEEVLLTPSTSTSNSRLTVRRTVGARAAATSLGNATLANNVTGLDITLRSVERLNANTVRINMVWMNTTSSELVVRNVNQYGGIYTSEGDEYTDAELIVGSKFQSALTSFSGNFSNAVLPSSVPVKAAIVVKNVPAKTFTFSMIKIVPTKYNGGQDEMPVEIRNLTVPEQEAQVFKGKWQKMVDSGDYGQVEATIDINLYAKSIESMAGDWCYGTVMVVNPNSAKFLCNYSITQVNSIDGNTASVVIYDEMSDTTTNATLTYKPETDTMCLDNDVCISRK